MMLRSILSNHLRCSLGVGVILRRSVASLPDALRLVVPGTRPSAAYAALVAADVLRPDDYQRSVLPILDTLHADVTSSAASLNALGAGGGGGGGSGSGIFGSFSSIFGQGRGAASGNGGGIGIGVGVFGFAAATSTHAPRGIYLHGGTGCGKTLLLDIFVACAPRAARARRVHFHAFVSRRAA